MQDSSLIDLIAIRSTSQPLAIHKSEPVSVMEFLQDVNSLAARLDPTKEAINLCQDRYHFAVSLFACAQRGIDSRLPNSSAREHIALVAGLSENIFCISDHSSNPLPNLPYVFAGTNTLSRNRSNGTQFISSEFDANKRLATVFTSGSTGNPKPHHKTLGSMYESGAKVAKILWEHANGPCSVVSTVPFRHMYGLEYTVTVPILHGGTLSEHMPYYAADVAEALSAMHRPRMLVTTPYHLHMILESGVNLPEIGVILSATAPLGMTLAAAAEKKLGAPLLEIYGSTETGPLGTRRTAKEDFWTLVGEIGLQQKGEFFIASGGHLSGEQQLNDYLEIINSRQFRLLDRHENQLNIAGKRASLAHLNHLLQSAPGVRDAIIFDPQRGSSQVNHRLAAFIVAPQADEMAVLGYLRQHVDQVFLPRPLIKVESIERDSNGKVTQKILMEMFEKHQKTGSARPAGSINAD